MAIHHIFRETLNFIRFTSQTKLDYNRVFDVQCVDCENVLYSQPYDNENIPNKIKKFQKIQGK